MEEDGEVVVEGHIFHHVHSQHIVVSGRRCHGENGSELVLARCDFVVEAVGRNTKVPELAEEARRKRKGKWNGSERREESEKSH